LEQLISKKEAARRLSYHPEHLMRLVRRGEFPRPIRAGHGPTAAVRFLESEVTAWLAARMAQREAA
jgi:predicted DNA-binding transcriptional regulator AlpA